MSTQKSVEIQIQTLQAKVYEFINFFIHFVSVPYDIYFCPVSIFVDRQGD